MCNDTCEPAFQNHTIQIDEAKRQKINRETFGNSYSYKPHALKKFQEIVSTWPEYKNPELKAYTCDVCNNELDIDTVDGLPKGYHVWWKMNDGKTLAELHFHKNCAATLGITE